MKNFRICNLDLNNWYEKKVINIIDVVNIIKSKNWNTYEIELKSPVTGDYTTLFKVENGVKVYENEQFNIPVTFRKIKELR